MNRAAKSYLTAGVALAGASVIAVSPVVATPLSPPGVNTHPAFSVSTADLQLATTVNPIAAWAEVVSAAYGNVAALGEEVLSDPAPILRQFILNQLSNGEAVVSAATGAIGGFLEYISPDNAFGLGAQLRTAAEQLSSGNIAGAIETATQALFLAPVISVAFPVLSSGLLEIPGTIAQNFANVVKTVTDPNTVLPIALGALGTVLAPVNAFGDSTSGKDVSHLDHIRSRSVRELQLAQQTLGNIGPAVFSRVVDALDAEGGLELWRDRVALLV